MCFLTGRPEYKQGLMGELGSRSAKRDLESKTNKALREHGVELVRKFTSGAAMAAGQGDYQRAIELMREFNVLLGGSVELQQQLRFFEAMKVGKARGEDVRFQCDDGTYITMRKQG
jgi:hypothetical protein